MTKDLLMSKKTNLSVDYLVSQLKSTIMVLDSLKTDYNQSIDGIKQKNPEPDPEVNDRITCFETSIKRIDFGLDESNLIIRMCEYIEANEAEKRRLKIQISRLTQENNWLRDELTSTQHRLESSEVNYIKIEVENKHLKFLNDMKQYDDRGVPDGSRREGDDTWSGSKTDINEDLGFADEEKDATEQPEGSSGSLTHGYEVSAKLRTLHNLVIQYASTGRYEVAVPLCKQTLEDLERNSGRDHPDVATMLNILALVYRDQGKYRESANLLQDALAIREKTLGLKHSAVAATLNNLAVLYGKRGRYKDAEPLCKRALVIREEVLGSDHPDVAKQLNNLALLCKNQGKYEEVEVYYQRALEIYLQHSGPNDINVVKTKNNLANAYIKQQKYEDAELLYKQILTSSYTDSVINDDILRDKSIREIATEFAQNTQNTTSTSSIANSGVNMSGSISSGDGSSKEMPYLSTDGGSWYKSTRDNITNLTTNTTATLRNLSDLYKRQNRLEDAELVNAWISKQMPSQTPSNTSQSDYRFTTVNQSDLVESNSSSKIVDKFPNLTSKSGGSSIFSKKLFDLSRLPNKSGSSTTLNQPRKGSAITTTSSGGGGDFKKYLSNKSSMLFSKHADHTQTTPGRLTKASSMSTLVAVNDADNEMLSNVKKSGVDDTMKSPNSKSNSFFQKGSNFSIENLKNLFSNIVS